MLLLNVYLPYDNNTYESLDYYMQILAEISAIIQNCNSHEVVIMGDFNADFKRRFGSATDAHLLEYNLLTDILLSSMDINLGYFACNDEQCCNADHHSDIDSLYMHIVNSLFNFGIRTFCANERNHHRTVPGWNKHVAELHVTARSCYMRWRDCGKPRRGLEYDYMNYSRARFKLKFRDCLRNEDSMKADAIAMKLRNKE